MKNYLECVKFFDMLTIKDDMDLNSALKEYLGKSYIPICRFSRLNKNIDSMQTLFKELLKNRKI